MSELKPCPFCGTQLDPQENQAVWDSEQFYEHPKVEDCHLSGLMFPDKFWNTRPIEDELCAELARRINELHYANTVCMEQKHKIARRDEIISRLKEDGGSLASVVTGGVTQDAEEYWECPYCMAMAYNAGDIHHSPDCPVTLHRALMKELE